MRAFPAFRPIWASGMMELTGKPVADHRGKGRRVLIVVENLPVPFDRRVWAEATTLAAHGYTVSVISPKGKGFEADYELLDGVHVYRHDLPPEGNSAGGYLREYGSALSNEIRLAMKVKRERGIDILHGCNPPDLIFLVAWVMRVFGVRYLFDHHDICPELYEAKFDKTRPSLEGDGAVRVVDVQIRHRLHRHQ